MEIPKKLFSLLLPMILIVAIGIENCNAFTSLHSVDALEKESLVANGPSSFSDLLSRRRRDVTETESEREDKKCEAQKENFAELRNKLKDGKRLEETHVFANESKFNLALAWAGENDDGTLLVLTTDVEMMRIATSTLWRSKDNGRTWDDWSSKVDNKVFRKDDGLQRNPHNAKKVYLISYQHFIYVTEDGGETWKKREMVEDESKKMDITVDETLQFHPEKDFEDYILVVTNDRQLYVTYDNFQSKLGNPIKSNVHSFKWGAKETGTEKKIYVTHGEFKNPFFSTGPTMLDLDRYDEETKVWKRILSRVTLFNIQGKFMYASIYKSENPKNEEDEKLMMISSDGGNTWNEAQLPTLTGDRFFSVLDMSEGLIFMHVDNPGDTGHGILYTSSADGIVYSESLKNHLFPNYNNVHDFYKIESIRGVYLASQMGDDKSIHTVITYDRGGEWENVSRPLGVPCENQESDGCYLQIHNAYSIHRGIKARLPHSVKDASGIVLVHAHIASNLQTTPPDVFLSTDGGYNFKKVLKGPHAYEIADRGGLLVAVPLTDLYPNTLKFSLDEGDCWHTYQFTNESIRFTGLLTEPGGNSMTVSLWGYESTTKKWTVNVVDFKNVVADECKDTDYEDWTPHISRGNDPQTAGCLLGRKETFKKIRKDSWCKNGYHRELESRSAQCPCSKEDYECEFGFYRPRGSDDCVRQLEIRANEIEICKNGKVEEIETAGYRLIPGDECDQSNGFKPFSKYVSLSEICQEGNHAEIINDTKPAPENTGSSQLIIWSVLIIVLVLLAIVGAFFTYKLVLLRRHKVVYRYSTLNQNDDRDDEFENALTQHDTLYNESSDEEVEQENKSPQHLANGSARPNGQPPNSAGKLHVKSYHDDSDDDMLN